MEIIAGDIGATKSWLAWVEGTDHASHRFVFEQVYPSDEFPDAEALLRRFMRDAAAQRVNAAAPVTIALALPGAVYADHARLTNLDWTLQAADLQRLPQVRTVHFINDFQAAAAGVATLAADDTVALNSWPADPQGVRAITGAGTGLGLAWMQPQGPGRYQTFATEGGHVDFAPADARQAHLLDYVRARLVSEGASAHVSWERMVSGLGLDAIYRFCLQEMSGIMPAARVDGARLEALAAAGDPAANAALDLFVALYGAWVGNVALLYRPAGGLYIAGGVAIHLQQRMRAPLFLAACLDKGRMRGVVEQTPILLIMNKRLGVQGAIALAFQAAMSEG